MRIRPAIVVSVSLVAWEAAAQGLPSEPDGGSLETSESASASESSPASEPSPLSEPSPAGEPTPSAPVAMVNDDVVRMVRNEFSDETIVAAIEANPIRFDISPSALVVLKDEGVSEPVIEAMLAAEADRRQVEASESAAIVDPERAEGPADPAATPAQPDALAQVSPEALAQMPPEALAQLSPEALAQLSPEALAVVLERRAAQAASTPSSDGVEAAATAASADAEANHDPHLPQAWITDGKNREPFAPSIAEVAITNDRSASRLSTLGGLASKALAFANPALGTDGLGGLFRSDDPKVTAVWALPSPSASRRFGAETAFEVEFDRIPGVNPNDYDPAIVQLVPTPDNYRLVGAVRTRASELDGIPSEPIIEEPVTAELTRLARGRYRVALPASIEAGEYALVLRPIEKPGRRRRNSETTLGELIGGGAAEVLHVAWDFAIE